MYIYIYIMYIYIMYIYIMYIYILHNHKPNSCLSFLNQLSVHELWHHSVYKPNLCTI